MNHIYERDVYTTEEKTDEEIFHSFIESINNAIGNKSSYDFSDPKDFIKFIEDYFEEFVFCMYNDKEFQIELLEIPKEFKIVKTEKGEFSYIIKNSKPFLIKSEENLKIAQKIFKSPNNGCACVYKVNMEKYEPLYMVNFIYSQEDKVSEMYKKVIKDYIELKEIKTLFDLRKQIISSYKFYKQSKTSH